ncbi:MAG: flavodoxin [Lachnospiraceae bacterium]|nr:flavodoxin [Lachnospiraceae bacterium]
MDKVYVIYWSQTGNTQVMAEAVGEGVKEAGKEAEVLYVGQMADKMEELKTAKGFALGCPAMGAEVLEEMEMEPFVMEVEGFCQGKTVGLFGSYGWGDGQWMRDWEERMGNAGATVLNREGIICQELPDAAVIDACKNMGKELALA